MENLSRNTHHNYNKMRLHFWAWFNITKDVKYGKNQSGTQSELESRTVVETEMMH